MAKENTIVLTDFADSSNVYISDSDIVKVVADSIGALVQYNDSGARLKYVVVSETPAQVAALSSNLINLTEAVDSTDMYLNENAIIKFGTDTLGCWIIYNDFGSGPKTLIVSETPAAVQALSDQFVDVTEVENDVTIYLNVNRMVKYAEDAISLGTDTVGSSVLLDTGFNRVYVVVAEEPQQLEDRIAAL
jgi:hypothetical protein